MRTLWAEHAVPRKNDRAVSLAYRIKELLDADDAHLQPIQKLLPALGFSYAHLCRIFRRKFGISPVRYRNVVRLERAKELLRDPKLTITEAAYAAGFQDPAYFTRKFHECYGVPPSHLR